MTHNILDIADEIADKVITMVNSVELKEDNIYAFMRLMAVECIIEDNVGRALNICEFLLEEL